MKTAQASRHPAAHPAARPASRPARRHANVFDELLGGGMVIVALLLAVAIGTGMLGGCAAAESVGTSGAINSRPVLNKDGTAAVVNNRPVYQRTLDNQDQNGQRFVYDTHDSIEASFDRGDFMYARSKEGSIEAAGDPNGLLMSTDRGTVFIDADAKAGELSVTYDADGRPTVTVRDFGVTPSATIAADVPRVLAYVDQAKALGQLERDVLVEQLKAQAAIGDVAAGLAADIITRVLVP